MTIQAPPKWLDDQFAVLPTNYVTAINPAPLTPAAGATATLAAPSITVEKSGVFLILIVAKAHVGTAGHGIIFGATGTDSFVAPFSPTVPTVADATSALNWSIVSLSEVDASGLARGQTVTYSATIAPEVGGDSVVVPINGVQIVVVEL